MTEPTRWRRRTALTLALFVVVTLASAACRDATTSASTYHCPMHPTYVSDQPGDCPICGMRLVAVEPAETDRHDPGGSAGPAPGVPSPRQHDGTGMPRTGADATSYTCPMHPKVVSKTPGKCPECGMDLVPTKAEPPAAGQTAAAYTCPMHPKVVSKTPGKCPECGMDLVPTSAETPGATPPAPGADATGRAGHVHGTDGAPQTMAPVSLGAEARQLAGIVTEAAVRDTMSRTIRTVGSVVADEARVRRVHTKVAGWVENLSVTYAGQRVKQGAPLLAIYSPELLASQEEFLRARAAAARFAVSEIPEVRRGGADLLAAARRRLELLDVPAEFVATLERTGAAQRTVTLLVPASGFVTAKATYEGQQVEPGMELFTITDLSHVWIEGDFYEFDASVVRVGQRARLRLPYDARPALSARATYVYPSLNPDTRTLRVRFEAANRSLALKLGMFVNIELDTEPQTALVVPDSAVLDTGTRQVVFVEAGSGHFEPRDVRIGVRTDGRAQVVAGLDEGERVVVRANFLLDSESRLRAALTGSNAPATAPRVPGTKKAPGGARP